MISVRDLPGHMLDSGLRFDGHGDPADVLTVVQLDDDPAPELVDAAVSALAANISPGLGVLIGLATERVAPGLEALVAALDCTVVGGPAQTVAQVHVSDPHAALADLRVVTHGAPRAASSLATLLRQTSSLDVGGGLAAESAVYSMLLAGPEFTAWRNAHPARPVPVADGPAVLLARDGDTLVMQLNQPARRNAFDRRMRDELIEGLELVAADSTIDRVELRGRGPSFGAGGDLDEFGSFSDTATAHLIRLDRSVGARIHACRDIVTAHLHGACIGSGIELPAFAAHVHAAVDTIIRLPEVTMGLVPGAGGTVSVTKRVGRWRTAFLALTGRAVDARTAHEWGLVDHLAGEHDA